MTNFLKDTLLLHEPRERSEQDVSEILSEEVEGVTVNTQEEPGFEMVTKVSQSILLIV